MTVSVETIGSVAAPAGRRPGRSAPAVPARAAGVELLGEVAGSGYRNAPSLVRRADGQAIQLTPLLAHLLDAIDGERDHAQLAVALTERTGRLATPDDVAFLVETKLRPLGVLRAPDGSEPALHKPNPLLALHFKFVVSNPAITRRIAAPFAALFHPAIVAAVMSAFVATITWVAFSKGLASALHQAIYEPGPLLLVFGLMLLSAAFHELGHAAACRYSGASPGAMGVGLYLVWPAFYTDVTDSYRLDRRSRLRVDLGGLYFNAIFAVVTLAVWWQLGWDALLLVIVAQLFQMVRQLVPVVRFDGYHVLADLVGVPDLFAHIKPTVAGMLRPRRDAARRSRLKPWARAVVTLWVALVVPLLAALLVVIVLVLPRVVATAVDSLGVHWAAVQTHWSDAAVASVVLGLLSMLMIALPAIGIPYLLARTVSRAARWTWRSTANRAPLRAGAGLVAAALLAGTAYAWNGSYRPIEADEQWTIPYVIGDGIARAAPPPAVVAEPVFEPMPTTVPAPAPEPQRMVMVALVPTEASGADRPVVVAEVPQTAPSPTGDDGAAGAPPTAEPAAPTEPAPAPEPEPAPAPADEPTREPAAAEQPAPAPAEQDSTAWPFPFAPPQPAEEGDNQVVVVNTSDNTVRYSTSLSLVWVEEGEDLDERNEAWALASCTNCGTVAIAFQVVLGVGDIPIVIPMNSAVAVNYECEACHTAALAVQLVATLLEQPDDTTLTELNTAWLELERSSTTFHTIPLGQVHDQLLAARQGIFDILDRSGVLRAVVEEKTDDEATDETDSDAAAGEDEEAVEDEEPAEDAAGDDGEPATAEQEEASTTEPETAPTTETETTPTETTTTDEQADPEEAPSEEDPSTVEAPDETAREEEAPAEGEGDTAPTEPTP